MSIKWIPPKETKLPNGVDYSRYETRLVAQVVNSFPPNPRDGHKFTDPYGIIWQWDGVLGKWCNPKQPIHSNGQPVVHNGHIDDPWEAVDPFVVTLPDGVEVNMNAITGGSWKRAGDSMEIKLSGCSHEWKEYVGLTQRYNYCTKCDKKEGT